MTKLIKLLISLESKLDLQGGSRSSLCVLHMHLRK